MRKIHHLGIAAAAGAALLVPSLLTTSADASSADLVAHLQPVPVNGVQGDGTAFVNVQGNRIDVTMVADGLLADAPHAAHIHFGAQALHECPVAADDADMNGFLTTSEGAGAYGPVVVSLTKTGDTSPASTLAIDRYDTAPGGELSYQRGHIKVSHQVARAISDGLAVIVIHGVDHDGTPGYSGPPSDLAPSLPTEATDPALCGVISN
jgi:hypothetical protein